MKFVFEVNGREQILSEEELTAIVQQHFEEKPSEKVLSKHIEDDMPEGLSEGDQFFWRQDHGLTSSSEDRFGF